MTLATMPTPVTRRTSGRRGVPAIMDLEASGFGRASYPIEVGYVLGDGTSFCTLIRPTDDWRHWDASAEGVHHITRDTLERHGRPVQEVARMLNDQLKGQTLYSDGWGHDYAWLAGLFEAADVVQLFRLDSLRKLLTEREADIWNATRDQVTSEFSVARHRASIDAWVIQQTWIRLQDDDPD